MQEALIILGFTTLIGIVGSFCSKLISKVDAIADGLQGIKETQIKQGFKIETLEKNQKSFNLKHAH